MCRVAGEGLYGRSSILHDDLKYFAGFAFEQTVIGKHNCRPTAGFKNRQHVLEKI